MTTTTPVLRTFNINVVISGIAEVQAATEDEARDLATAVRVHGINHTEGRVTLTEITVVGTEDLEGEPEDIDPEELEECAGLCRKFSAHTEQDCGNCGPVTACANCNVCPRCGNFTRDEQANDIAPDLDTLLDL